MTSRMFFWLMSGRKLIDIIALRQNHRDCLLYLWDQS